MYALTPLALSLSSLTQGTAGVLLLVIVFLAVLGTGFLLWEKYKHNIHLATLRGKVDELREISHWSSERLAKLEPHALNYYNGMSPKGIKQLSNLKEILSCVGERLSVVEEYADSGEFGSAYEGLEVIDSELAIRSTSVRTVLTNDNPERDIQIPPEELADYLDSLFQSIGKELSEISAEANRLREESQIQPPRGRPKTIRSLKDAGIRLIEQPDGTRIPASLHDDDEESDPPATS